MGVAGWPHPATDVVDRRGGHDGAAEAGGDGLWRRRGCGGAAGGWRAAVRPAAGGRRCGWRLEGRGGGTRRGESEAWLDWLGFHRISSG
jgi:hypothetical protein